MFLPAPWEGQGVIPGCQGLLPRHSSVSLPFAPLLFVILPLVYVQALRLVPLQPPRAACLAWGRGTEKLPRRGLGTVPVLRWGCCWGGPESTVG